MQEKSARRDWMPLELNKTHWGPLRIYSNSSGDYYCAQDVLRFIYDNNIFSVKNINEPSASSINLRDHPGRILKKIDKKFKKSLRLPMLEDNDWKLPPVVPVGKSLMIHEAGLKQYIEELFSNVFELQAMAVYLRGIIDDRQSQLKNTDQMCKDAL
jgi:hypothetical protein